MGLTGIQIFQMLPKTNCKECGVPTCLAFAMKLAAGQAELSACPYVSDEAKQKLAAESAPPIRTVEVGTGDGAFKVGGETVLFRHEKTFFNPAVLGVLISDDMDDAKVDELIKQVKECEHERVGVMLKAGTVAVKSVSGDAGKFKAPGRLADRFHTYGLEWTPEVIRFYFDGRMIRERKNTHWHQALHMNFDSETMPNWFGLPEKENLPSSSRATRRVFSGQSTPS